MPGGALAPLPLAEAPLQAHVPYLFANERVALFHVQMAFEHRHAPYFMWGYSPHAPAPAEGKQQQQVPMSIPHQEARQEQQHALVCAQCGATSALHEVGAIAAPLAAAAGRQHEGAPSLAKRAAGVAAAQQREASGSPKFQEEPAAPHAAAPAAAVAEALQPVEQAQRPCGPASQPGEASLRPAELPRLAVDASGGTPGLDDGSVLGRPGSASQVPTAWRKHTETIPPGGCWLCPACSLDLDGLQLAEWGRQEQRPKPTRPPWRRHVNATVLKRVLNIKRACAQRWTGPPAPPQTALPAVLAVLERSSAARAAAPRPGQLPHALSSATPPGALPVCRQAPGAVLWLGRCRALAAAHELPPAQPHAAGWRRRGDGVQQGGAGRLSLQGEGACAGLTGRCRRGATAAACLAVCVWVPDLHLQTTTAANCSLAVAACPPRRRLRRCPCLQARWLALLLHVLDARLDDVLVLRHRFTSSTGVVHVDASLARTQPGAAQAHAAEPQPQRGVQHLAQPAQTAQQTAQQQATQQAAQPSQQHAAQQQTVQQGAVQQPSDVANYTAGCRSDCLSLSSSDARHGGLAEHQLAGEEVEQPGWHKRRRLELALDRLDAAAVVAGAAPQPPDASLASATALAEQKQLAVARPASQGLSGAVQPAAVAAEEDKDVAPSAPHPPTIAAAAPQGATVAALQSAMPAALPAFAGAALPAPAASLPALAADLQLALTAAFGAGPAASAGGKELAAAAAAPPEGGARFFSPCGRPYKYEKAMHT